jgi:N-acetylneuraminic acid mutarotase
VLFGRLFLLGGEGADNEAGVFSEVEAYDPRLDSWQSFPPLTLPRHGFGAAVIGDEIYLPGGAIREGGSATDVLSVYSFAP